MTSRWTSTSSSKKTVMNDGRPGCSPGQLVANRPDNERTFGYVVPSNRSSDLHQSARSFAASRLTVAIGLTLLAGTAFAQGSPGEDVFNSSCVNCHVQA